MKVLVIGAGKMVEAILSGLGEAELHGWGVMSRSGVTAKDLSSRVGIQYVEKIEDFGRPDWILLGVKPQQIHDVEIPDVPVMSLLAAIPEKDQKVALGVTHLVRVMPNLPVRVKKGVSLMTSTSEKFLSYPEKIFGKLGLVKVLPEDAFTELTLLTGSGPALFYEFTKNLASSFQSLSQSEREELARMTLLGAAAGAETGELGKLIDAVTSKGGVTIAVLEEWRKQGFVQLMEKGVARGLERSEEIRSHLLQK